MATKKAKKAAKPASAKAVKKVSKPAVKKAVKSKAVAVKHFDIVAEQTPFMTFKITRQTILWSALLVYVLLLSIWILNLQMQTLDIITKIS